MTIQVITSSSQSDQPLTTQSFSYDPGSDAPPLARLGPGQLQFRDVLPDGTLGPIWSLDEIVLLSNTDFGPRLRFPDGTEIVLDASPDQVAQVLSNVATAAGDRATGDPIDDGGSSQAVNDPDGDLGGLGSDFGSADGGVNDFAGGLGGSDDDLGGEDPNLILTVDEEPGPEILPLAAGPTPAPDDLPAPAPAPFVPDLPGPPGGPGDEDEGLIVELSVDDEDGGNQSVDFDPDTDVLQITDVIDQDDDGLDLGDLLDAGVTVEDSGDGGDVTVTAGENSVTLEGIGTGAINDLAALDDAVEIQILA